MKTSKILSLLLASAAFLPIQANANPPTTIQFPMVKSKGAGGTCPFTPSAKVTVHTLGTVENLEVVSDLSAAIYSTERSTYGIFASPRSCRVPFTATSATTLFSLELPFRSSAKNPLHDLLLMLQDR
jgi:hypothetical protein